VPTKKKVDFKNRKKDVGKGDVSLTQRRRFENNIHSALAEPLGGERMKRGIYKSKRLVTTSDQKTQKSKDCTRR